ncbi:DNA polymerase II [archaeon]|nr:DNA polymerase II [archaeon]
MTKKEFVGWLYQNNFMISPNLLKIIPEDFNFDDFFETKGKFLEKQEDVLMLNEDLLKNLLKEIKRVEVQEVNTNVEIVSNYWSPSIKKEVKHFVSYFRKRYEKIKSYLLTRTELQGVISLSKVERKVEKEPVAIIGVVLEKNITKNGHVILTLEDPTGKVKVLIHKNNKESYALVGDLVLDEIIGITGVMGENIVFADALIFPEVPLMEFKKCEDDVCAVFTADFHVGSDMFVEEDLERFIGWLNLEFGDNEQKELAKKVKYIFVAGDLVDGVGIYPGQDKELVIKDIVEQYDKCAEFLGRIRKDIKIIICGGNHDALRIAEPQPPLNPDFAGALYKLKNVKLVTNPSIINIHKVNGFQGFNVLMYHGYCFDYYVNNVESIRTNGGYDRADLLMEFLLKKRHLAPTHSSTLYMPDLDKDPLVIESLPDFFVSGHVHHDVVVKNFKNITLIGAGSWQKMTSFQEKLGHTNIVPARVPVVSLKTRQVKVMDFRGDKDE